MKDNEASVYKVWDTETRRYLATPETPSGEWRSLPEVRRAVRDIVVSELSSPERYEIHGPDAESGPGGRPAREAAAARHTHSTHTHTMRKREQRHALANRRNLAWMRRLAENPATGIVEVALGRSTALARFVDTRTLKDGQYVCQYFVRPYGAVVRNWVHVDSESFQNNGRATVIYPASEAALAKSVLDYQGKHLAYERERRKIMDFLNRYELWAEMDAELRRDPLRIAVLELAGKELSCDYDLDDAREALREWAQSNSRSLTRAHTRPS